MVTLTSSTAKLWVGLGCRRGVPLFLLEEALQLVCRQYLIDWETIAGLATIDAKRAEPGLLAFSLAQHWPLLYFTQAELKQHSVPNPSVVVNTAVGVSSVCEAAALRAAAQSHQAMWSKLIVPKQVFRGSQGFGSVTVAIATPYPKNLPKAST